MCADDKANFYDTVSLECRECDTRKKREDENDAPIGANGKKLVFGTAEADKGRGAPVTPAGAPLRCGCPAGHLLYKYKQSVCRCNI